VKPNPFKGVPAGTLLTTAGVCTFDDIFGGMLGVFEGEGEGVNGVEKGGEADVEVAGGGSDGLAWAAVVERPRILVEREMERSLRR